MRRALVPLVLMFAGACATPAPIQSEAGALRRGCAAIHARLPRHEVSCADLAARPVGQGTQWLVAERDAARRDGAANALFWADGRFIRVWVNE